MGTINRPLTSLMIGIVLVCSAVAGDWLYSRHLVAQLNRLVAECKHQAAHEQSLPHGFTLLCEPSDLEDLEQPVDVPMPGVQGEIVAAKERLESKPTWPAPLAALLAVVLSLPWLWYFLLNRLRELRNALR